MAVTKQNTEVRINEILDQLPNLPTKSARAKKNSRGETATTEVAHFDVVQPSPDAFTNDQDNADNNVSSEEGAETLDYHVRAGRIGGQTTKQRHRDSNFYREIGARGGTSTMARHAQEYEERRKKGGETTRERYGEEYYHSIAEKAAKVKQDATRLRNDAIKTLLGDGLKIPTIIKLTMQDLHNDTRLQKHIESGPVAEYLKVRLEEDSTSQILFLSQSGKPLSLANTYTIMERHKS
jgi:hypothetical protein